jgi:Tol biopolymer transport system component
MKRVSTAAALLFSVLVMSGTSYSQDDIPIPDGPYLGQTPPGSTPKVFAPGIVNTEEFIEIQGMFGADMNTFYFVRLDEKDIALNVIEYKNNQWKQSVVKQGVSAPSISSDGKTIYLNNSYIKRTSDGWSEPKKHGAPFDDIDIMRLSASSNGTYYFDTFTPKTMDTPIRYSRSINGKYELPKSLGPQFGIGRYNAHPFIAPDESYIIFDSVREEGYGRSDLYISFRAADDSWGPALNLGDKINTAHSEKNPSLSPDGKFLFFSLRKKRGNEDVTINWVDAQIIETLRPK